MNMYTIKNFIKISLMLCGVLIMAQNVSAAKIILQVPEAEQKVGELFPVDIMLDPESVSVNALSMTFTLPRNFSMKGLTDSDSIIALWVKKPKPIDNGGRVEISGIIPGGFAGLINPFSPKDRDNGRVIRFLLMKNYTGNASTEFSLGDVHVYQNDGLGTELPVSVEMVSVKPEALELYQGNDQTPPLSFEPVLIKDPLIEGVKYALVFDTKDKESGMDHFEVRLGNGSWVIAESPYPIPGKKVIYPLLVKAVDRAGNEQVETVAPLVEKKSPVIPIVGLAILGAILAVLLIRRMRKLKR